MESTLINIDCVGQDELCKVISPKVSESPEQDSENCKIGDFQEPDYIDADIFTPIVKTGFQKFRLTKSLTQIIWVKQYTVPYHPFWMI